MDQIMIFVLVALLLGYLMLGWYFSSLLIMPQTHAHGYVYDYELGKEKFDKAFWESLSKEEVHIKGRHGHRLYGLFLDQGSDDVVILCHGHRWNLMGSIKYVEMFYQRGFNVLLFDHRAHGLSEGKFSTFGFYEKEDLKAWVDWLYERMGKPRILGTHGESLGGASVLQHLGIDERVDFCISDCAYADLHEILQYRMRYDYAHIKLPVLSLASFFVKLRIGFHFKEISPLRAVSETKTPILLIHGEKDAYVPSEMSQRMYQVVKNPLSKLWLVPEAKHAGAFQMDKVAYSEEVGAFIKCVMEEKNCNEFRRN